MTIVINHRMTAMMLPRALAKIVNAIKGEVTSKEEHAADSRMNPMDLAPRKLFLGIVAGVIIIVIGTFPLVLMRIANTEIFLIEMMASRTGSTTYEVGKQIQLTFG